MIGPSATFFVVIVMSFGARKEGCSHRRTPKTGRRQDPGSPCPRGGAGAYRQGSLERRPRQDTFSDPHASETCRREGSGCPRHQGRRLTPRHPAYRRMGGPTAPAERSLRRSIRRRARRIGGDGVPLGSDPWSAQPARPPAERPPCLVPAVREVGEVRVTEKSGQGSRGNTAPTRRACLPGADTTEVPCGAVRHSCAQSWPAAALSMNASR